jgi:hypothetical protein
MMLKGRSFAKEHKTGIWLVVQQCMWNREAHEEIGEEEGRRWMCDVPGLLLTACTAESQQPVALRPAFAARLIVGCSGLYEAAPPFAASHIVSPSLAI